MKTSNAMDGCLKFNCRYGGQHMECAPRLAGRQLRCPTCQHRIVIPKSPGDPVQRALSAPHTWDTDVPLPTLEILTRYRAANVLARAA
jgi:hypothetical protein